MKLSSARFSGFLLFIVVVSFAGGAAFLRADDAPATPPPGVTLNPGPVISDEQMIAALNLDYPGLEKVKAAVQAGDLPAAKLAYLDYRRTAPQPKWQLPEWQKPARNKESVAQIGDEIVGHYIPNLFYTGVPVAGGDMGADFDWKHNPMDRSLPSFTDQWTYCVISRCQFWEPLATAYDQTHDEKYAQAWVQQMTNFAMKNPAPPELVGAFGNMPDKTVSLWLALDNGTRMNQSWPYAYTHFLQSPSFTPDAQWLYLKMMQESGQRLRLGMDSPKRTGNWLDIEGFGLYTIGVLFPELKDASSWRDFVMSRLLTELNRSVPPDGMEGELTPMYHMVSVECVLGVVRLAELNHLPVPDLFKTKLLSMFRALVLIMDQAGNDVPTNDSAIVNARGTARQGLQIEDDPLLEWAVSKGQKGTAPPVSTMLPYAGFYVMRGGWNLDDLFLFFRGGPTGVGHQHEDMLEVVLRAWNQTLLFDPGTYSYDASDWRGFTIGTASHNTIIVDGKWQNRGAMPVPTQPMDNPWATTPLFDFASATYDAGYQQRVYAAKAYAPSGWVGPVDKSVSHTRHVLFLKPYYALVLDTLDGTGNHLFEAHYNLDADTARVDPATQAAFSQRPANVQLALYSLDRDNLKVDVVKGQMNPLLGWLPLTHRAIPTVRMVKQQDAPAIFATFLYPYQGATAPAFTGTPLAVQGDGIWAETLTTPQEKAEIAIVKKNVPQAFSFTSGLLGPVQVEAATFLARQPAGKGDVFAGGWDLRAYSDGKVALTADAPASLVFEESGDGLLVFNGGKDPVRLAVTRPFIQAVTVPPQAWTKISSTGATPAGAISLFDALAPLAGSAPPLIK
jgi:hypothetical protein